MRRNYGSVWRDLGSVDGKLYGVWFKAADKSLVWYSPATFARAGIAAAPRTWAGLVAAAARLRGAGVQPLAVAGADGWTLTDWFENVYLRTAGPRALRRAQPARDALDRPERGRGAPAARRAARRPGSDRPAGDDARDHVRGSPCATCSAGRSAPGWSSRATSFAASSTRPRRPARSRSRRSARHGGDVVVGGDVAVLFHDRPDAARLIRFLATPAAAEPWARSGGFLSPNAALGSAAYPDAAARGAAAALSGPGTIRFDLWTCSRRPSAAWPRRACARSCATSCAGPWTSRPSRGASRRRPSQPTGHEARVARAGSIAPVTDRIDATDLDAAEQALVDAIAERRDEIVALACDLIRFDTQSRRDPTAPPRQEAALQAHLAERLRRAGAEVDVWEPEPADAADHPLTPPGGIGFAGRPQLAARFRGAGGGRSLLLNGHVDVVPARLEDGWAEDPFDPQVRDGMIVGRGSCDMKGGIAAMVVAAEALAASGRLRGDVIVCTNTDEESSGTGALACARHGVAADFAIVPEPSGLEVWPACRGSVYATVVVPGRAGHSEQEHAHWRDGGAVNAIDKARHLLDGVERLRADWRSRAASHHPLLSPPDILCTRVRRRRGLERHDPEPGRADAGRAGPPGPGRRRRLDSTASRARSRATCAALRRGLLARRASARVHVAHAGQPVRDAGRRAERARAARRQRRARAADDARRPRLLVRRGDVLARGAARRR